MRDHPIPSVTEPLQYRAIGIVRGTYTPNDSQKPTRGYLSDGDGNEIEAVVLGRVLPLMKRHLSLEVPHLWVVYPRSREADYLHLQIAGIWEPSTLGSDQNSESIASLSPLNDTESDQLPEGDDYFSIRGELIYSKPDNDEVVIRVRQRKRSDGKRSSPFKLQIKGKIPIDKLRYFVSLDVRRKGQNLVIEDYNAIEAIQTRGGKKKFGGRGNRDKIQKSQSNNN